MTDDGCLLDGNQINIRNEVSNFYRSFQDNILDCDIHGSTIRENIGELKRKCAPGIDGVTTEHMLFALSDTLCTELASVYSHMFKYNAVPDVLQIGIIVPILKKSTLPSYDYNNFRPITLSTVHAKLVELIILPMVNLDIGGNQYAYQTGKGTEFCCALLNDSVAYFNEGGSAVYMYTLDDVKCFDNIWHEGLFCKLMSRMSIIYWRLLFNWYKSMRATIRLNNKFSQFLNITKGTRQGSVLSPHLFNVFIDLMRDLEGCPYGLRIGSLKINTAGYADDITLIASTQPDLQKLVDICYRYSCKWRFSFGPSKSKCIIMRKRSISLSQPDIWLGTSKLQFVDRVQILGRVFSHNLSTQDHISSRMQSSRRAMFGMGINNEGISPSVKAYLWKSVGVPSLVYALGTCNINQSDLKRLESFQGTVIKNSMYLGKQCHHSALLKALEVPSIESLIEKQRIGLLKRAFRVKSPYTDLVIELISKYIVTGIATRGTLIGQLVESGHAPLTTAFDSAYNDAHGRNEFSTDIKSGLIDSLKYVVDNVVRLGDAKHTLLYNLCKCTS